MNKLIKFKMNKNKISRKKSGIHSPALMLLTVLMVLGYIFMIIIFARMAVINREEIRKEAEAGNELIRIYVSIDEEEVVSTTTSIYTTTSGTQTQTITTTTPILNKAEKTRITITNQWGKTSVIDYFVVEAWNEKIISQGEFNPPLILEAGEERILKGNDILNTFRLNDVGYAEDFWFFKDHIRCILLHTKLGNTFGSAYKPTGYKTITHRYYYINYTAITINQTFTTTYYGSYTLIIESQISYYDCIDPVNNVWRWYGPYNDVGNYYVRSSTYGWTKNMMNDIINPNSDPYGRKYLDGSYVYPAGILLTISHSLPWSCSGDGWVYYRRADNSIMNFEGGLGVNIVRMELWELDQFGNEVRKILETTSSSITFAMFGNYKLKRFFEGRDRGQVSNPTTTTQTYTITATGSTTTTIRRYADFNFPRSDGAYHDVIVTINPLYGGWYIKYDGKDLVQDAQYVASYDVKVKENPNYLYLKVEITLRYKDNAPYTANAVVRVYYITWGPI